MMADETRPLVSRALGGVAIIWDTCGCVGLCPECWEGTRGRADAGCGRRYIAARVRGVADELTEEEKAHLDSLACPIELRYRYGYCKGLMDAQDSA